MDDVLFTFDVLPFQNAMKTMSKGINMLIKRVAGLTLGFLSVRKALSFMPEVGRSFSIAGEIMTRNFLNPLRRQLIPILQSMLDWVRDHRALFVRWGSYLVNIFVTVKNIIKGFIGILQNMWERLSGNLERIFGSTTKTVSEVINLILFKIAALASFIMITIEPVFNMIVDGFSAILNAGKSFFEGFAEGIGDIWEPLDDFVGMLKEVGRLLGLADSSAKRTVDSFKILGAFIGSVINVALTALAQKLDTVTFGVKLLAKGIRLAKALTIGTGEEVRKIKEEIKKDAEAFKTRREQRIEREKATFSRFREVVRTEGEKAMTSSKTSNINVAPITVNVTEGNSQKAGEDFAKGLQKKLIDEDTLEGGR